MNVQRKEKGFTIIEVVLVLAIAGLIFLMVFIALPALQRSQRDTQRKNDLSRAMTAVTNYTSNNRGNLPADGKWNDLITKYLEVDGDDFSDPVGTKYTFSQTATVPTTFSSDNTVIVVTTKASCNGEEVVGGKGSRKVALQMKLEGGGVACQSN